MRLACAIAVLSIACACQSTGSAAPEPTPTPRAAPPPRVVSIYHLDTAMATNLWFFSDGTFVTDNVGDLHMQIEGRWRRVAPSAVTLLPPAGRESMRWFERTEPPTPSIQLARDARGNYRDLRRGVHWLVGPQCVRARSRYQRQVVPCTAPPSPPWFRHEEVLGRPSAARGAPASR